MANDDKPLKQVRAQWAEVILVCRKCSKKLDGGFGKNGREGLARELRRRLCGADEGRKAGTGVVQIGCLDICPRNAVMVLRAAAPGRWIAVPKGTSADIVVERLGLRDA